MSLWVNVPTTKSSLIATLTFHQLMKLLHFLSQYFMVQMSIKQRCAKTLNIIPYNNRCVYIFTYSLKVNDILLSPVVRVLSRVSSVAGVVWVQHNDLIAALSLQEDN